MEKNHTITIFLVLYYISLNNDMLSFLREIAVEKVLYEEKLNRWMLFAKANKIRKVEAWPFWFQVARSFSIDLPPIHFWSAHAIWLYYFICIIGSWITVVYIFTRTFENILQQENLLVLIGIAFSVSTLLCWNILRKKKRFNLTTFEEFT